MPARIPITYLGAVKLGSQAPATWATIICLYRPANCEQARHSERGRREYIGPIVNRHTADSAPQMGGETTKMGGQELRYGGQSVGRAGVNGPRLGRLVRHQDRHGHLPQNVAGDTA